MSAAAQTKIFGLRIGVDPKILVGGLIVMAALLFWYNSHGDEETSTPATAVRRDVGAPATALPAKARVPVRRSSATSERGVTLRLRPIDATRGDVDPTLRLDLLNRMQFVKPEDSARNLFELGPPPLTEEQKKALANAPRIVPKAPPPPPPAVNPNAPPVVNIPLQYYGFVKGERNRGLFLDGDNVLVASEGEVLKQRYRVVELKDNSARLEDVQLKQGQTLPVVPVAVVQ